MHVIQAHIQKNTLDFLKKFVFDSIIIESTLCYSEWRYHMSFKDLENFTKWIRENKLLKNYGKSMLHIFPIINVLYMTNYRISFQK